MFSIYLGYIKYLILLPYLVSRYLDLLMNEHQTIWISRIQLLIVTSILGHFLSEIYYIKSK